MSYPLATAERIAEHIRAEIAPFCHRVAVAGSVRRQKPEVKDIELVVIPKWEKVPGPADLFGESVTHRNLLRDELERRAATPGGVRWIKPSATEIVDWPLKAEAKYWRGLMPNGIKLDVFIARPDNWGVIYLIRTGSALFNVALFSYGKKIDRRLRDGELYVGRVRRDCFEEKDVFDWFGLEVPPPERRHDEMAIAKSKFAKAGGLALVPDPAAAVSLDPGARAVIRLGEYVDQRSGECYPVEILEEQFSMVYLRFTDERPADWHREGWFTKKFLNGN